MKNLEYRFLKKKITSTGYYLLLLAVLISCKNDPSGGGDSSFFSFGSGEVEELGNADVLQQELEGFDEPALFLPDSLSSFYRERNFKPAWSNSDLRNNFLSIIQSAETEGLNPEDYHGEEIMNKLENLKTLGDNERSRLDILMTDAFLKFSGHLYYGKTDPKEIHEIWDVPKEDINRKQLLEEAVTGNINQVIETLRPTHPVYRELIAAAGEYRDLKENTQEIKNIPEGEVIEPGMQDERLYQIQERLKYFDYLEEVDSTEITYSGKLQEAIKNFQRDNGIEVDGIIGNGTIRFLNKGYDARYDQIIANLERWRWYPRDLGDHYLLVNIANYRLTVVKDSDTVSTHKTMVGTEARKTPVFSEKIDHVVFNPTWTIPPTIKSKDVIPGMRKNKNYLASKNISVYDEGGQQVNPSRINWSGDEALSYTFRQESGPTNPLGRVKIIYPNEYLIYLHDTPAQALFKRDSRAESSGCVRVENVVDLAKYLLDDQPQYSSEEIDQIIERGETKQIDVNKDVKVHHFYWTAWKEDGTTKFTEDIYNYDPEITRALKKAS